MRRCIAVVATVVVLLIGMAFTQIDRADEPLVVSIGEQLGGDVDFARAAQAALQPGEHVLRTIAAYNVVPLAVVQVSLHAGLLPLSGTPILAAWNYDGLKTSPIVGWDGVLLLPRSAHSRSPALVLLL